MLYFILTVALFAAAIYIYLNWDKKPGSPPKNTSQFDSSAFDATGCVRRGIDQKNDVQNDLNALFSRHCRKTNSFFMGTSVYENAVMASPAFLLIFCRLCLIANGMLTRSTPKIETAMTSLYGHLSSANGRERLNSYIDYFQSFLPPNSKLPRCDIFNLDDSILDSQHDNYAFILFVAFGDCILNPQLVTEGSSAPIAVCDAFDLFNLESILEDRFSPYMSEFIDDLIGHFMCNHEYYSLSLRP